MYWLSVTTPAPLPRRVVGFGTDIIWPWHGSYSTHKELSVDREWVKEKMEANTPFNKFSIE